MTKQNEMETLKLNRDDWFKIDKSIYIRLFARNEDSTIEKWLNANKGCTINVGEDISCCNEVHFVLATFHEISEMISLRGMCAKCTWDHLVRSIETSSSQHIMEIIDKIKDPDAKNETLDYLETVVNFGQFNLDRVYKCLEEVDPKHLELQPTVAEEDSDKHE